MPGAGSLDHRITLQRATVTINDFGEEIESWSTLATVFAGRRDASAAESYRAQWVLATWMIGHLTLPVFVRVSGIVRDNRDLSDWLGAYLVRWTNCIMLSLILLWGGFWS